jgi:hypothetical protein
MDSKKKAKKKEPEPKLIIKADFAKVFNILAKAKPKSKKAAMQVVR